MADMLTPNRTAKASDSVGFRRMFAPERLMLGVFFPIEAFSGDQPTMLGQKCLARRAEALGYAALWCRDVPLRDPSFGDVGQIYDPWVYLGWIAARTSEIALPTGSLVLTLRQGTDSWGGGLQCRHIVITCLPCLKTSVQMMRRTSASP